MFYRPADRTNRNGGLAHSPFNAIVAPRPIAWISTRCSLGDNLAPYSFFNAVAYHPPQVMFSGDPRDTVAAIRETLRFAVNTVSRAQWKVMNETSAQFPRGTDEFAACGVQKAECETIDCPRVAQSAATLECVATQIIDLEGGENTLIVGRVEGVHIDDACLTDGRFDPVKAQIMARLGYMDYAQVTEVMELMRPR
jgi:flavin reductase (DIM6/NTAB) family NADH-FMN oxidoreductase RutF